MHFLPLFGLLILLCYAKSAFSLCPDGSSVVAETVEYNHSGDRLLGYVARCNCRQERPAVLVVPDWNGRDEYENHRAEQLAELGYVGFAVDVYGNGKQGQSPQENMKLMEPFSNNRTHLLNRLKAALDKVRSFSNVDRSKVAAQGYCFGGLGVLDMARAGVDISGVVSFHGNLSPPPEGFPRANVAAKILVQSGYDDPTVKPEQVKAFEDEMKSAAADYQVISFGNTVHSFTVPGSNAPGSALYSQSADRRSWNYMKSFYEEIFS